MSAFEVVGEIPLDEEVMKDPCLSSKAKAKAQGIDKAPLRILFMHGLEGGPHSTKPRFLKAHFSDVECPAMNMGVLTMSAENSFARSLVRQFWRNWPWEWKAAAARDSLERCLEVQAQAIEEFKPDIVVGSSWGGGIALLALARGIWRGPTVAIAPALRLILEKAGETSLEWGDVERQLAECRDHLTLVHGTEDHTIPFQYSEELAAQLGCELIGLEGGDHSLNRALLSKNKLRDIVLECDRKSQPVHVAA